MKNADMKVIAIILSIALFFTIVTSNIVSIASIAVLLTGGSGAAQQTTDTSKDEDKASEKVDVQGADGVLADEDDLNKTDEDKGTVDLEDVQDQLEEGQNEIEVAPFAVFQKAINEITTSGKAGYDKKAWQSIEGNGLELSADSALVNAALGALKGTLTDLIKGFMTAEEDASVDTSAKGSPEAMDRMPESNCTSAVVKSATCEKSGENFIVTIVMHDQINPAKKDTDGLRVMSKDILYMEDVVDTIENDDTVSAVVKELKVGEIRYNEYTITAVMTADHQFVSIDHDCIADLTATIDAVAIGVVHGEGQLGFHTRYTNFVY